MVNKHNRYGNLIGTEYVLTYYNSSIKYSRASSRGQVVERQVNRSFEDLRWEYFIEFSRRESFQLHV